MLKNTNAYRWVKNKVEESVTSGHLVLALGDYGHEVSLAYQNPQGDRIGVYLRDDRRVFDINDLSDEDQEDFIQAIIKRFQSKEVLFVTNEAHYADDVEYTEAPRVH